MFFHQDYAAPGPGIDPDEPEKTGWARFVQILQVSCVDLVKLNLLFLLACLPVVTIPLALYAMDQVVRRMVLDRPVDCFYHFRLALQDGWKRAYAAFLLTAVPLVCAGYGAAFYLRCAANSPLFLLPFLVCSTIFLTVLLSSAYFYGALGTRRPFRECLRLGLVLGIGRPGRAAVGALACYGPILIALLAFPISGLYLLLIGFSVPCLLGNFFVRTVLQQYCPADPEKNG